MLFRSLFTRGDGKTGQDITHLIQYVIKIDETDLTKKLSEGQGIRGELIISKGNFKKISNTFKNGRNAVAGLVNSKNINPELARDTYLVLYQIIDPVYSASKQFEMIKEMGFRTVHSKSIPSPKALV